MRFKNYLKRKFGESVSRMDTNSEEYQHIVKTLSKDCMPICKLYNKKGKYFYRGLKRDQSEFVKKDRRTNREPLNTDPVNHKILDRLFLLHWGWKVRSTGVFVSNNISDAKFYGGQFGTYYFFPIGELKYLWSPVIEDSINLDYYSWNGNRTGPGYAMEFGDIKVVWNGDFGARKTLNQEENEKWEKGINKVIKKVYTDKDIEKVLDMDKRQEIIFDCDSYYCVNIAAVDIDKLMENIIGENHG